MATTTVGLDKRFTGLESGIMQMQESFASSVAPSQYPRWSPALAVSPYAIALAHQGHFLNAACWLPGWAATSQHCCTRGNRAAHSPPSVAPEQVLMHPPPLGQPVSK